MMLSAAERESYRRDGFLFPLQAMSAGEAAGYRRSLEGLETQLPGGKAGFRAQLNYPHLLAGFADALIRHSAILDAVRSILGPDLLVWGATFFIKEPHTESFVSWHQDLRYWGLSNPEGLVSAWLALGPVTRANGCMRFVPGSHHGGLLTHEDHQDATNILTRGQTVAMAVDEENTVAVELEPGQFSLHHGRLLHASAPNRSDERRIGLAINYIAPSVSQTLAETDFATLVSGEDRYGHFELMPAPEEDLSEAALACHARVLAAQSEIVFDGAAAKQ
ncbi:MAG: phytanoyl-CoA dioxygenase family protein [Pseudomonadota bacterium]